MRNFVFITTLYKSWNLVKMRKRLENHREEEEHKSQNFWPNEDRDLFTFCLTVRMQWKQKMIRNYFFFWLLSHQLLYFHLKVKNSDRAETVILTPTIIVALELPFLFFLMTNYRMTLCENTILGLVIYITIPNNQNSWVYGVLWLQIVVSLLFAK